MATFVPRELHLLKKSLAIAVLAMENKPGDLQSGSDQHDMKLLLDRLVDESEMDYYTRSAWIAVFGKQPPHG